MTIEKTHIFSDETAQEIKGVLTQIKEELHVDGYTKLETDTKIQQGVASANGYTDQQVAAAIVGAMEFVDVVSTWAELPNNPSNGNVYIVNEDHGGHKAGTAWVWVAADNEWKALDSVVDLSGYVTTTVFQQAMASTGQSIGQAAQGAYDQAKLYTDNKIDSGVDYNKTKDRPYTTGIEVVHHDAVVVHHDEVYDPETPTAKHVTKTEGYDSLTKAYAPLFNAALYEILPTMRGGFTNIPENVEGERSLPSFMRFYSTFDQEVKNKIFFTGSSYSSYNTDYRWYFNGMSTGANLYIGYTDNYDHSNNGFGGSSGSMYMFDYGQINLPLDDHYGEMIKVQTGADLEITMSGNVRFYSNNDILSAYPSGWSTGIPMGQKYHFFSSQGVESIVDNNSVIADTDGFIDNLLDCITPHESILAYSPVIGMSYDQWNMNEPTRMGYRKNINTEFIPSRLLIIEDAQIWEPDLEWSTDIDVLQAFGNVYEGEDPWGNRIIQDTDFFEINDTSIGFPTPTQADFTFGETTLINQYNGQYVLALKCKEVLGAGQMISHHNYKESDPRELYLYFQILPYDWEYFNTGYHQTMQYPTLVDQDYTLPAGITRDPSIVNAGKYALVCRGMISYDCMLGDYEYSGTGPSDPSGVVENIIHNPIFPQNYFIKADQSLISGSDHYFKEGYSGADASIDNWIQNTYLPEYLPSIRGGIPSIGIYDNVYDYTAAYDEIITPAWDEDVEVARPNMKIAGVDWDVPETDSNTPVAHISFDNDDWNWVEESSAIWNSPEMYFNDTLGTAAPNTFHLHGYQWAYPIFDINAQSAGGWSGGAGNAFYHYPAARMNNREGEIDVKIITEGEQKFLSIKGDIECYHESSYNHPLDSSHRTYALIFDREVLFGDYAGAIQLPEKTFYDMNGAPKSFECVHNCGSYACSFIKMNSGYPPDSGADADMFDAGTDYAQSISSNGSFPLSMPLSLLAGEVEYNSANYDLVAFVCRTPYSCNATGEWMWHIDAKIPVTILEG